MATTALKLHCGTCGRRLVDLKATANGFHLWPREGVRLASLIEFNEARWVIGCWCPGKTLPGEREQSVRNARHFVLTVRALQDAWKHHETDGLRVVKLGDEVSAGRIR